MNLLRIYNIRRLHPVAIVLTAFFFIGLLLPATSVKANPEAIGRVISHSPGAHVLRDGKKISLTMNMPLRLSDTVQTDATGKAKILFNDDSTVSLGSNTSVDMSEYVDSGNTSAFGMNVSQGIARISTGRIVNMNPNGFKVTTPNAVAGIRGTVFSVHVAGEVSTIYVEHTLRQVHVNGINVPSAHKITISRDVARPRPVPILPQDRNRIGREISVLRSPC